jgi:histidine ammonia-lyase
MMILQNLGQGYSGVRLSVLEKYREFLNKNLTPWAPREGSVGYLCPEAHIALVLTGRGQAYYDKELLPATNALQKAKIDPITLSSKEGLALVSGTTSVTGLAILAIYDMLKASKSADIIASLALEALHGIITAFDRRVMSVRPHVEQSKTASNVRRILADSQIIANSQNLRVQDALSLRCIPQLHGAAKKTLEDAKKTIETEINSCCDNPIIWSGPGEATAISACNADSSYIGIEMDSASIAATTLAKMSERRNNRLIDENLSGLPWFLIKNPGLNSGLMIPQYTQAGLLGDMRILSTPSTVDNTPTCGNQEDYVAMGYNSSKKAIDVAEKLEYILAIELLSVFEAQSFLDPSETRSSVTYHIIEELANTVPVLVSDRYLYPYIEFIRNFIHSGRLIELTEEKIGALD